MDSVYCVFKAFGDGDGYTCYDLIGVYTNFDKCIDDIMFLSLPANIDPVNMTMSVENNYTVITERSKCVGNCKYGHFGGYVVEKVLVNKLDL